MSDPRRDRGRVAPAVALLLTLVHLAWSPLSLVPVFPDFDAAGYLTAANTIAIHGDSTMPGESPLQFVGVHWFPLETGGYVSRYPPGFPLLLSALIRMGGTTAALAANPALLGLALLLLFVLCRSYVRDELALLAVVLLAVNPLANGQALHVDSHPAAMLCLLAVVVVLDRWQRRPRLILAFGVGVLLGVLPAIRYAEAVCGLGVAAFVALSLRRTPRAGGHVVAMVCGAALPVGALLHRNRLLFGSWWRTGYALSQEQTAFSFDHLTQNLGPYVWDLWQVALLAVPLGVIGTALLAWRRGSRPLGVLLALTIALLLTVYSSYYWRLSVADNLPIRFLLPTIPLLLFSTAVAVEHARSARPLLGLTLMALLAAQAALQLVHSHRRMASAAEWSAPGLALEGWAEEHLPPGSIVVAGLPVATNLHPMGRWRLADGDYLGRLCAAEVRRQPPSRPGPLVGRESVAVRLYQGLDCQARRQRALADLDAWARDGAAVYLIAAGGGHDVPGEWREIGSIPLKRPLDLAGPGAAVRPVELSVLQLAR